MTPGFHEISMLFLVLYFSTQNFSTKTFVCVVPRSSAGQQAVLSANEHHSLCIELYLQEKRTNSRGFSIKKGLFFTLVHNVFLCLSPVQC